MTVSNSDSYILNYGGVGDLFLGTPSVDVLAVTLSVGVTLQADDTILFSENGLLLAIVRGGVVIYQNEDWSMFNYGVASGDPTPSGAVIWTRVNTWYASTYMLVEVSENSDMSSPTFTKRVSSAEFSSSRDQTYKLDLDGLLQPATLYYYRFGYMGYNSATGRFRTMPAFSSSPAATIFAVLTCQHYQEGYWHGLATLTARNDLAFILHLGDFIYDYTRPDYLTGRGLLLPAGVAQSTNMVPTSLADYRYLYKVYRTDSYLQALMAKYPFVIMLDDHEFANDSYFNEDALVHLGTNHPYNDDGLQMETLFVAARRAFYEYTPTREGFETYRRLQYGDLMDLYILNERDFRDPHPCGITYAERVYTAGCDQMTAADQTMLGTSQLQWLRDNLAVSTARWQVLGNPVLFSKLLVPGDPTPVYLKLDGWDGYQYERNIILNDFVANGNKPLVITGDLHSGLCARLYQPSTANVVGAEYMTPAFSSNTLGTELLDTLGDIFTEENHEAVIMNNNAPVLYVNAYQQGFLVMTIARDNAQGEWYMNDATDTSSLPTLSRAFVTNRATLATGSTYP